MMKTIRNPEKQFSIPRYEENAALQLVAFTGVTFILFHFVRVIMLVMGYDKDLVAGWVYPNMGLSTVEVFKHKFWTLLTYGLTHQGFWDWLTNMIWAYCFASILQSISNYKQVLPLFFYGLLGGGIVYLAVQNIFGSSLAIDETTFVLGAYGGVAALAITSLILSPQHKLHISNHFFIPCWLLVVLYSLLSVVSFFAAQQAYLILFSGGAFIGCIIALLLKNGFEPSVWVYQFFENLQKKVTPQETGDSHDEKYLKARKNLLQDYYTPTKEITQERIDELLDKINEKGYYSLTKEEKETLKKAGK